jgi:hypothetical protein
MEITSEESANRTGRLFQAEKHRPDREWRLLLTPNLALSNTAPNMIDDAFSVCIVEAPKRHGCLQRKEVPAFQDGALWPPTQIPLPSPFDRIVLVSEALQIREEE